MNSHGYLDQDGNFYWWKNTQYTESGQIAANACLKKYSPSGEILFEKQMEPKQDILEIRQTADGRMYLILCDRETESRWLAELEPDTGLITKLCHGQPIADATTDLSLGIYGNKPVILTNEKFVEINADDGTESLIFSLDETTYTRPRENNRHYLLQDFRIPEDGSVEIIWATSSGSKSLQEKLQMAKVEKIPVVLNARIIDTWLSAQISSFNQSNETYQVIVETGTGDWEDFARLTSVQIASGKGPDILSGDLMQDYIPSMMEKGTLEDQNAYMKESGIREEDYFPFAFATWRDGGKIYGISPESPILNGYRVDSTVLGGMQEPDIETLVNVLLAGREDTAFLEGYDSQALLALLLKGTDKLWGMVDWEKGSCNFEGELFAQILEVAKRYGDNGDSGEKIYIAESRRLGDIIHFDDLTERTRDGKVICGVLFDDGCHVAATPRTTLAINANSSNKEGAWEFISFLLSDDVQAASISAPASRKAFELWVEADRTEVADGREIYEAQGIRSPNGSWNITGVTVFSEADITEEIIEEYMETLEDARPYPIRTAPILDIISEEAADYFNGSKSAAEVGKVVTNRVQTYLDEGH